MDFSEKQIGKDSVNNFMEEVLMLKELKDSFELDPKSLEIGDHFFCIERNVPGQPKLLEYVVKDISTRDIEAKAITKGERDIRLIKDWHCFIYGGDSEAVKSLKMEIILANLLREVRSGGLSGLEIKLQNALTEWDNERTKPNFDIQR